MAIKRVVLHLGMSKAGSTSIQQTLYKNTAILEKSGFRYLTEWGDNHLPIIHYLLSPHPVTPLASGHLGKSRANKKRHNQYYINTMLKVINTTECETLILSGDYFHEFYLDSIIDSLKEFIKKYFYDNAIEVSIIYLIRNPLTWMVSYLQQRLSKDGYVNKNCDFFEFRMQQYMGVINLKKYFSDSLILLKFEDSCLDKDGLVGCFLKAINFPEKELKNINIFKLNDARCLEVLEFLFHIETIEPRYPYKDYKRSNPYRFLGDLLPLRDIKGIKYDLPYHSKIEFWNRFQETIRLLKEDTGIDYTDYSISPSPNEETYSEETIQGFIDVFPKLSIVLQGHFLKFFEKKYMETTQERFKKLYFRDSIPWNIYNKKNIFICYLCLHVKKILGRMKRAPSNIIPYPIIRSFKRKVIGGKNT